MPRKHIGGKRHATPGDASGVWYVNEAIDEILEGNWPNNLETHVGSFTPSGTTGTQSITFGAGIDWTPKAIIFFTAGSIEASGTWKTHIWQCVGFTAGPSSHYAVAGGSADEQATSQTSRGMEASAILIQQWAEVVEGRADLDSFNAGGFTLNWTNDSSSSRTICYVALGGDIEAEVLNWQSPNTTGNHSVSTGTIQPDLVFNMTFGRTALGSEAGVRFGLGAMNSDGEQWTVSLSSRDNAGTGDTSRYQRTSKCISWLLDSTGAVAEEAEFVSMDANGFTTNFTTTSGGYQYASLCIKGVRSKLGAFSKSTDAAPATQSITAPGFEPGALLFANDNRPTESTPVANAYFGLGAYDGTNMRAVHQFDQDAADPTAADSVWVNDRAVIADVSTVPATTASATAAFTASGFDLTWDPNAAAAVEVLYAALTSI